MDFQSTKEKVLKLCDKLAMEGILTKEEHETCQRSYVSVGTDVERSFPESQTSAEYSFGMLGDQGTTDIGQDITKKRYIKAFIRSTQGIRTTDRAGAETAPQEDKNRYLAVRDESSILYMESMSPSELLTRADGTGNNMVFTIRLEPNNYYSIQNDARGNYIKAGQENAVLADTNNLTENAYWKLVTKIPGKIYCFESVNKPGQWLTAGIPVGLSAGKSADQNWSIEPLDDAHAAEKDKAEFEASRGRAMADKVISSVFAIRLKYYFILAKLEFLTVLRDKILNMVKPDGSIMSYYYDMRANREIQMSDELLNSISVSIDSEVRNREILLLEDEMRKLILESEKLEGTELSNANTTIAKLMAIIDRLIAEKKNQIASVNLLMERINGKQVALNQEEDKTNKRRDFQNTKGTVNNVNTVISAQKTQAYQTEYWGLIVLYVIVIMCIGFGSYKLYKKYTGLN